MKEHRQAPVFAQIGVDAAPETVWDVLADIENWPEWNPEVKKVSLEGELAAGTVFRWKTGSGRITSTLCRIDRPGSLSWIGRTFGINAIHVWNLETTAHGTLARTEESFHGFVARVLRALLSRSLQHRLESDLQHLKAEAERRSNR